MKKPNLKEYSIEALVLIGNSSDGIKRDEIKSLIVEKILMLNKPIFYILNKFRLSNNILREAYAKVILIKLGEIEYNLDDVTMDNILALITLDDLTIYGTLVKSFELRKRCEEVFWARAFMIKKFSETNRKTVMYKRRLLIEKIRNGRMIEND